MTFSSDLNLFQSPELAFSRQCRQSWCSLQDKLCHFWVESRPTLLSASSSSLLMRPVSPLARQGTHQRWTSFQARVLKQLLFVSVTLQVTCLMGRKLDSAGTSCEQTLTLSKGNKRVSHATGDNRNTAGSRLHAVHCTFVNQRLVLTETKSGVEGGG